MLLRTEHAFREDQKKVSMQRESFFLPLYFHIYFSFLVLYLCKATMMVRWTNTEKWARRERYKEKTVAGWTSKDWRRGCKQRGKREAGWSWRWRNRDE